MNKKILLATVYDCQWPSCGNWLRKSPEITRISQVEKSWNFEISNSDHSKFEFEEWRKMEVNPGRHPIETTKCLMSGLQNEKRSEFGIQSLESILKVSNWNNEKANWKIHRGKWRSTMILKWLKWFTGWNSLLFLRTVRGPQEDRNRKGTTTVRENCKSHKNREKPRIQEQKLRGANCSIEAYSWGFVEMAVSLCESCELQFKFKQLSRYTISLQHCRSNIATIQHATIQHAEHNHVRCNLTNS